jgi:hypothetical protein
MLETLQSIVLFSVAAAIAVPICGICGFTGAAALLGGLLVVSLLID